VRRPAAAAASHTPRRDELPSTSRRTPFKSTAPLASDSIPSTASLTSEVDEDVLEDAGNIYRRIRDILSTEDFETFAQTVADFNDGRLTVAEVMRQVQRLVPDPTLVQGMRRLIMSVVRRSEMNEEDEQQLRMNTPARRYLSSLGPNIFKANQGMEDEDEEEEDGTFHTSSSVPENDARYFDEPR
jgi:hypothetical protein